MQFTDAHNYFVEFISKAYQALTDPISRENFEKYGHPDGRQVLTLLNLQAIEIFLFIQLLLLWTLETPIRHVKMLGGKALLK